MSKTGKPGADLVLGEIGFDVIKNGFRLPTEAEWEFACRAGSMTRYFWGDDMDERYVWDQSNSGQRTHPVGQKKPNNYGLFDISGNVWEWCYDWYGSMYGGYVDSLNSKGPDLGYYRVFRGGSWLNDGVNFRCTTRKGLAPGMRDFNIGFRCVLSR
jgi:formylglycine-generating enzyme required for sulfatase activity